MLDDRSRLQQQQLTDSEVDTLYDILEITDKIFATSKIDHILEGGSLLGHVRCGGLLPHDNDADMDVLESDLPKIRELNDEFSQYDLVIIETPGWGLQISHKDSPDLDPKMWTDGTKFWSSKWPFLDLIAIKYDSEQNRYILAGDVAQHDYPNYYLTKEDWEGDKARVKFGHLKLLTIGTETKRIAYLDRHYPGWRHKIVMNMDHRTNQYFDKPIYCDIIESDLILRPSRRSGTPVKIIN